MDRFNFGSFAGDASQRVQSIVSAAETEAAGLLRDAEREAELIKREAQGEADRILEDARRRADELLAQRMQLLADIAATAVQAPRPSAPASRPPVTRNSRPAAAPVEPVAPPPPPAPRHEPAPVPRVRRPEPVAPAPEPPRRVDDHSDARFDGARLVALQMAVAGSTREEVHAELQRAFRLSDPSSILDDVFGGPRRSGVAS